MKALPDHLEDMLGYQGKIISGSKGRYANSFPENLVIFNANLVLKTRGKIWYGDLDVTTDIDKLIAVRSIVNEDIYLLMEHEARFSNEKIPKFENFFAIIRGDGVLCKRWNGEEFLFEKGVIPTYKPLRPDRNEKRALKKERDERNKKSKIEYELKNPQSLFQALSLPKIPAGSKGIDPLNALQKELIKAYGKDQAQNLWTNGYISKADKDLLTEAVMNWLNKYKKIPKKSYYMKKQLAWLPMEIPREFLYEPNWSTSGSIYLKNPVP